MKGCAAVVPAAGLSSRMEQYKPLLTIGNETIADRVISLFTGHKIDVYLVVGWQKEKLIAGLKHKDIRIIENPEFHDGMFTSIKAGAGSLGSDYQGFFVLPVDIPLVRPFTIRCLLKKFREQPDRIIYPVFNGLRGHPPLIPASIIPDILEWDAKGYLKAVLEKHESISLEITVPDMYILSDLDTYHDYEKALDQSKRYDIPTEEECKAILDICQVDPARRRHCYKVAEIAGYIGRALSESGQKINLEIIRAAASLHDIARGQSGHDEAGGRLLKEMGFDKVGEIVGVHTFLQKEITDYVLESKVVYIADKFAQGDSVVSLESRFQSSIQRFGGEAELEEKIRKRLQRAHVIKSEIEVLLGYPLESVVFNAG